MLKELDKDKITENTKWEDIKPLVKKDPRYSALNSKSERERLFCDYAARIIEKRQEKLIIEQKRDNPEDDLHRVRSEDDRLNDAKLFQELLRDHIQQTNLTWFEAVKFIEKDKRYGQLSAYTASMQDAYKEYIKNYR